MSGSYPPPAPKRLTRSSANKMIGGVCAGVANYLNMDPTLVRVLTVILTLFTGVPVIVYLVALFVMPEDHAPAGPSYPPVAPSPSSQPGPVAYPSAPATADPVWGTAGAPWEQPQTASAPVSDPPPVEPPDPSPATDPQPPAPSDPEAPVVPPSDDPNKPAS